MRLPKNTNQMKAACAGNITWGASELSVPAWRFTSSITHGRPGLSQITVENQRKQEYKPLDLSQTA